MSMTKNNKEYSHAILEDVDEVLATTRFEEVADSTDNEIIHSDTTPFSGLLHIFSSQFQIVQMNFR